MIPSRMALRSRWTWGIGLAALIVIGFAARSMWWGPAQNWVRTTISGNRKVSSLDSHDHGSTDGGEDPHAHEGHNHAHDDGTSLVLSAQAQGNIGLGPEYLQPVRLETFRRSITVPGIIVGRPGRSRLEISTPMAGVITHVHAVQGEAVDPGTLLFQLRITAEELVSTQTNLLRTVGELDVENREIARLSKATEGAIAPKTLLERQYAKEKLEVLVNAQREALRLHGLSERQIDDITKNHKLLRDLQIVAPGRDHHGEEELKLSSTEVTPVSFSAQQADEEEVKHDDSHAADDSKVPLILQEVLVHKGETVAAGTTLGALADYSELYIEGRAFEQDVDLLSQSAQRNWKITAVFEGAANSVKRVENLALVYSASEVDAEARSLSFFVLLPNEVAREAPSPNGQRFLDWKYRPGQRLQLLVPVEEWENQIVLPIEAIAREGAESFVFQQNGNHFDRVSIRVAYRDSSHVVVANDGSIFPGDVIALRGAHQMQMALRNKSGGGVDPHAGHNH